MKNTKVSDEEQWDILEYLFQIYPERLTEDECRQNLGDPENAILIANVRQLIADDLVGKNAVIKTMTKETVFASELRLTPTGVNLMQNSESED